MGAEGVHNFDSTQIARPHGPARRATSEMPGPFTRLDVINGVAQPVKRLRIGRPLLLRAFREFSGESALYRSEFRNRKALSTAGHAGRGVRPSGILGGSSRLQRGLSSRPTQWHGSSSDRDALHRSSLHAGTDLRRFRQVSDTGRVYPLTSAPRFYFCKDARRGGAAAICRRSRQWPRQKRRPQPEHRKGRNEPNSRSGRSQVRRRDRLSGRAPQAGQQMLQGSLRRSRRDISGNVPALRVQVQAQQAYSSRRRCRAPLRRAHLMRDERAPRNLVALAQHPGIPQIEGTLQHFAPPSNGNGINRPDNARRAGMCRYRRSGWRINGGTMNRRRCRTSRTAR